MPLVKTIGVNLLPRYRTPQVPYHDILEGWMHVGFDAQKSLEVFRKLLANSKTPAEHPFFRLDGFADGGMLVSQRTLFPKRVGWTLQWVSTDPHIRLSVSLGSREARLVADVVRTAAHAHDLKDLVRELGETSSWFPVQWDPINRRRTVGWPTRSGAGIYRREHASVLIRSETTSVLVDPIPLLRELPLAKAPLDDLSSEVGAILITHSHGDHWHIPSIISSTARNPRVPVIVPEVPRPNLLCRAEFQKDLSQVGQTSRTLRWGETLSVGDIEIDALPFYGEQPLRDIDAVPEGVRSWGNCYRVTTPQFSVLLLVDSGADPAGDMLNVVSASYDKRGPVDALLACGRSFACPFFGGLEYYWAAIPFATLQKAFAQYERGTLPFVTAGPRGIVELCRAAKAKFFLSYANGFEGVSVPISNVGWSGPEPSEKHVNAEIAKLFRSHKAATRVLSWNPGDVARLHRGQFTVGIGRDARQ